MTKTPKTEFTSRAGVYYTGYVCSMAGIIFRETPNTDVGIDGHIEIVDSDGKTTGLMAGIQVKSGDSFVDLERKTFTFRAKKKHFEYWERFCLPVIGVVFSPALEKAAWFDLSKHSKIILSKAKSLEIRETLNEQNELNAINGLSDLVRLVKEYHGLAVTKEDVSRIADVQKEQSGNKEAEYLDKETAWKRLVTILFASNSPPEVIADAGYKISWYFPTITKEQENFFINRIAQATDEEIIRIIRAVHRSLIDNRDDVATLITDLFSYLPYPVSRLKDIGQSELLASDQLWVLQQVIEFLSQE